ncbi:MAG: shikimate kinase [Deferribacteraceae bacterium]|jgi:shikimate kinase|nr:shikimate kinase [Deferribacteraceae bacterium]
MNLYLTGPSGAGKSSAGKLLAESLSRQFIDLDLAIEKSIGKSIHEIFAQDGEQLFRNTEKDLLREYSLKNGVVIAAGGGTVLDESNRTLMRSCGKIMLLMASPATLLERVMRGEIRPLLKDGGEKTLRKMLFRRAAVYCDADAIIDTTSLTLQEVVMYIKGKFYGN